MQIAFIGIGKVGLALANRLSALGHQVTISARDFHSESVTKAHTVNPSLVLTPLHEGVETAEVIFLTTPFQVIQSALHEVGPLNGKIVVDCTNPINPGMKHALEHSSGGELVQKLVPQSHVVKAFTIYGHENLEDNNYPGYGNLKPLMLIAGNNLDAKRVIEGLCREMGWESVDTGDITMSLHLEHMAILWTKMVRLQNHGPDFVWAMLVR